MSMIRPEAIPTEAETPGRKHKRKKSRATDYSTILDNYFLQPEHPQLWAFIFPNSGFHLYPSRAHSFLKCIILSESSQQFPHEVENAAEASELAKQHPWTQWTLYRVFDHTALLRVTRTQYDKSDSEKFVPVFWNIRYKNYLFGSYENLIEYIHFKPVLAFQLAHGDMFSA